MVNHFCYRVEGCIWQYDPETRDKSELHCPNGRIEDYAYDDIGFLYYSIKDYGLFRLNLSDGGISQLNKSNSCLYTDWVVALDVDDEGNVWCSPALWVNNMPRRFIIGNGLYKINWDTKECLQWDNSNSLIPHNTILSLDVNQGQVYFSNVEVMWEVPDWEMELLIHFDGADFSRIDSGNAVTPLLRNVESFSKNKVSYAKYHDYDLVTDRYEFFIWNKNSGTIVEQLDNKVLASAKTYRDVQGNLYTFGDTKEVDHFNVVTREAFLTYNNLDIEFQAVKEINSLYRIGAKDSIWVGGKSLFYVPVP